MLGKTRGDWLRPKSKIDCNDPQCAVPIPLFQQTGQSQTEPKTVPPLSEQPAVRPAMGPIRIRQPGGRKLRWRHAIEHRARWDGKLPDRGHEVVRTEEAGL